MMPSPHRDPGPGPSWGQVAEADLEIKGASQDADGFHLSRIMLQTLGQAAYTLGSDVHLLSLRVI